MTRATLTGLNSAFSLEMEGGSLGVLLEHRVLATPSRDEVIVVDFDFAQTEALDVNRVEEYLDRAHSQTKKIFLSLVSDKYLSVIKGAGDAD